jgi:hypothetical protein
MGEFWREFLSGRNDQVNSATVLGSWITLVMAVIAVPAAFLGLWAFYHHVWTLKKGLDSSSVQLISILIGGPGVGCGVGYAINRFGRAPSPPPDWQPPPIRRK